MRLLDLPTEMLVEIVNLLIDDTCFEKPLQDGTTIRCKPPSALTRVKNVSEVFPELRAVIHDAMNRHKSATVVEQRTAIGPFSKWHHIDEHTDQVCRSEMPYELRKHIAEDKISHLVLIIRDWEFGPRFDAVADLMHVYATDSFCGSAKLYFEDDAALMQKDGAYHLDRNQPWLLVCAEQAPRNGPTRNPSRYGVPDNTTVATAGPTYQMDAHDRKEVLLVHLRWLFGLAREMRGSETATEVRDRLRDDVLAVAEDEDTMGAMRAFGPNVSPLAYLYQHWGGYELLEDMESGHMDEDELQAARQLYVCTSNTWAEHDGRNWEESEMVWREYAASLAGWPQ